MIEDLTEKELQKVKEDVTTIILDSIMRGIKDGRLRKAS